MINFIISKLNNSAPAKGLTAKVNLLSDYYDVNLIILKSLDNFALEKISKKVKVVNLTEKTFIKKIFFLRKFIKNNSSGYDVSCSLGFFSDFINIFFLTLDKKIISIRGSLHNTYFIDYGILGILLFRFHYWIASRASIVIVMTDLIAKKFEEYTKFKPKIVGNYIDEKHYCKIHNQNFINQKNKLKKFLFIGRFVNLKQPIQLINILKKIKSDDYNFELDMYGEGPQKRNAIQMVKKLELNENIKILDFEKNLWIKIKKKYDAFILPSLSEGVSRASLEALFYGIPVIARNVDSNYELITTNKTGILFNDEQELEEILKKIIRNELVFCSGENFIPKKFSQKYCENQILNIFNNIISK